MNDTAVIEPPTEPIRIHASYQPDQLPPSPAARWARAHGIYVALAVTVALATALSPLPRFESIVTGIAVTNGALWLLRKAGGR